MMSNEPMPNVDGLITTTWIFTVDVSGTITGSCNAKPGDCILVTNAPGVSFIGNIYALGMDQNGDQTSQLLGVDAIQVGTSYPIILSLLPDAPGVDYYLSVSRMAPLVVMGENANGTLRVGGG